MRENTLRWRSGHWDRSPAAAPSERLVCERALARELGDAEAAASRTQHQETHEQRQPSKPGDEECAPSGVARVLLLVLGADQ